MDPFCYKLYNKTGKRKNIIIETKSNPLSPLQITVINNTFVLIYFPSISKAFSRKSDVTICDMAV